MVTINGDSSLHFIFQYICNSITLLSLLVLIHTIRRRKRQGPLPADASYTYKLTTLIVVLNLMYSIIDAILSRVCFQCNVMVPIRTNLFIIAKVSNYLWFIHRAKLSQGLNPLLSENCFTKVLPRIVIIIGCIYCIGMDVSVILGSGGLVCTHWEDADTERACYAKEEGMSLYFIGAAFDIMLTLFLLALFVKPLMDNINRDLGELNRKQLKEKQHLAYLLKCYVLLTFINLGTTDISVIGHAFARQYPIFVYGLVLDPAINSVTIVIMLNTQAIERITSKCCGYGTKTHSIPSQFDTKTHSICQTELDSRNNMSDFHVYRSISNAISI
eukprot:608955_1